MSLNSSWTETLQIQFSCLVRSSPNESNKKQINLNICRWIFSLINDYWDHLTLTFQFSFLTSRWSPGANLINKRVMRNQTSYFITHMHTYALTCLHTNKQTHTQTHTLYLCPPKTLSGHLHLGFQVTVVLLRRLLRPIFLQSLRANHSVKKQQPHSDNS